MRIRASYSPTYAAPAHANFAGLAVIASVLERNGLADLVEPPALDPALMDGLHCREYLEAFSEGRDPLASSQGIKWKPAIRDAAHAMLSGQLDSARHALAHGVALNVARGFHHAAHARGAGFCALNGLAFVAHVMPQVRVFVIDCDEHGGNGTEELSARLPNLYCASIFGTRFGCFGGPRSWTFSVRDASEDFDIYASALRAVADLVGEVRPGLILYQAGVDCHQDDPKSRVRLTTAQIRRRDEFVFGLAANAGIPIQFNLAGGYQPAETLAELHAEAARAAIRVFGRAS